MLTDSLHRSSFYQFGNVWNAAFTFVESLDADCETGEYDIDGDRAYAVVVEGETNELKDSKIEAHREYVDIHVVLDGEEGYCYYPLEDLESAQEYDEENDFELFKNDVEPTASLQLIEGSFVVFLPQDAHIPMLQVGGKSARVKKVIVKVAMDELTI